MAWRPGNRVFCVAGTSWGTPQLGVDDDGEDDDRAQERFLEASFAADLNQPVAHDREQGRAEQCADDGAVAAEKGRAADDDGGNDFQLDAGAGRGGDRTEMGELSTPANTAANAVRTKPITLMRLTGMPESRAAALLLPVART